MGACGLVRNTGSNMVGYWKVEEVVGLGEDGAERCASFRGLMRGLFWTHGAVSGAGTSTSIACVVYCLLRAQGLTVLRRVSAVVRQRHRGLGVLLTATSSEQTTMERGKPHGQDGIHCDAQPPSNPIRTFPSPRFTVFDSCPVP